MVYAPKDRQLIIDFQVVLETLRRQHPGIFVYDYDIIAGMEIEDEMEKHVLKADIILLMISFSFLNSDYCAGKQVRLAVLRHRRNEAWVIPILLRPAPWKNTEFGKIQPLPSNGKSITDAYWKPRDKAYLDIFEGLQRAIKHWQTVLPFHKPPPENSVG